MAITTSQETGSEDQLDKTLDELLAGQHAADGDAEEETPELGSSSVDKDDLRTDETLTAEETTAEGEETAETSSQEADDSQRGDRHGATPTNNMEETLDHETAEPGENGADLEADGTAQTKEDAMREAGTDDAPPDDTDLAQEGGDDTDGATEEEQPASLEVSMPEDGSTPEGAAASPEATSEESTGDHHDAPEINSGELPESKGDRTGANDDLQKQGAEGQETADESVDTDADSSLYEEQVTDELNTGQNEEEEEQILDLEEPAEEDDQSPAEEPDDGQAVLSKGDTEKRGQGKADPADLDGMQTGGLSDEERGDLEKLITGLKEELPAGASSAAVTQIQKQMKVTEKRVAKLGKMILAYDKKLKACHEVMQLYREKTEIMNRRIDAVVAAMNNGKGT